MSDRQPTTETESPRHLSKADSEELHFTHLITVFAVSAGMVGVCLTAMGIIQLVAHTARMQTRSDELLLADSALLLVSTVCSFISMRMRFHGPWRTFAWIADICLLVGIAAIAAGAVLLAIDFKPQS
jgi:uncharacterized membrane protein HdeD (DUF308 family)